MTTTGYICLSASCRVKDRRSISLLCPDMSHSDDGLKLTLVVVFVCPLRGQGEPGCASHNFCHVHTEWIAGSI
jgi:hypothetical protein